MLAKLRVRGTEYVLLNAHRKWGDWSLVGGHVESSDTDWRAAAAREVAEEMAPLRYGDDIEISAVELAATEWGPVPSASANGTPTTYSARWYALTFKADPRECLARLPSDEFRLVRVSDLPGEPNLASVVQRAGELLPGGWKALPLSWDRDLEDLPLTGGRRTEPAAAPDLSP